MTQTNKKVNAVLKYQIEKSKIANKINPDFKLFGKKNERFLTKDVIENSLEDIIYDFKPSINFDYRNCIHCNIYSDDFRECDKECPFLGIDGCDCDIENSFFYEWKDGRDTSIAISLEESLLKLGEELHSILNA